MSFAEIVIEFDCYLTFWPLSRAPGGPLGKTFNCLIGYSSSPLIWYAYDYVFQKLNFYTPTNPLSVIPRAWPGSHNQNPVQYVIHLSLRSICAICGIIVFKKIDFVIEFYCYLTFGPLPRAPVGWERGAKKYLCSCTLHLCKKSYKPNLVGFCPTV